MDIPYVGTLAALAVAFFIPGVVVWWAARLTARLADLKSRLFRGYLTAEMVEIRRGDYLDRGLHFGDRRLKRRVAREVRMFALRLQRPAGGAQWFSSWEHFRTMTPETRGTAIREMWSDLMPQGLLNEENPHKSDERLLLRKQANEAGLRRAFELLMGKVERRYTFAYAAIAAGWSLLIAVFFHLNLWSLFRAAAAGRLGFASIPFTEGALFDISLPSVEAITGIAGSALLVTLAAMAVEVLANRRAPRMEDSSLDVDLTEPPRPSKPSSLSGQAEIAPGRNIVRALNFAGGGFDAIMQLGVGHALLVLQGRAPDAITGVSAGAITAAAVAEILQEGESLQPEKRLQAQLHRLNTFIEAAQRAPGELIDALLPDAYQIDSLDPLRPLEQPRFARKERDERLQASVTRSGLARLYNDLLSLDISIGTIARLTRRILGMRTLGELSLGTRMLALFGEIISLLTLLRQNLGQISSLLPTLLAPLFFGRVGSVKPMTAGGLLFFTSWTRSRLWRRSLKGLSFLALMLVWLALLLLPAVLMELFWTPWLLLIPAAIVVAYSLYVRRTEQLTLGATLQIIVSLPMAYVLGTATALSFFLALSAGFHALAETVSWIAAYGLRSWGQLGEVILDRHQDLQSLVDFTRSTAQQVTMGGFALGFIVVGWVLFRTRDDSYADLILGVYRLRRSFFQNYGLQQFLVRHFDPDHYGSANRDSVLENAMLKGDTPAERDPAPPKEVGHYSQTSRSPAIHLGIAVADAGTGELTAASPGMNLIKAITASCAVTPLFPPVEHEGRVLIDGSNIANQPSRAMIDLLRPLLRDAEKVVHVYAVSPFPLSQPLGRHLNEYVNLVDVVRRALLLRRKRDALFEHNLTKRITEVLPALKELRNGFFPAWVIPIELETVHNLNLGLLAAETEVRRKRVLEAVADGCRASLQSMLDPETGPGIVHCKEAVTEYFQQQGALNRFPVEIMHPDAPGLKEVCQHCCLHRDKEAPGNERSLRFHSQSPAISAWPHEENAGEPVGLHNHPSIELDQGDKERPERSQDPDAWKIAPDLYRPLVSCVFGGGVFRGVYQVGVLNGLSELGLRPDIMAGASVGSITAAMTARAFSFTDRARRIHVARLAAVYIGMDRLILTDRFADFVRTFTLQAADTGFSIRQADRFFRKYDRISSREFSAGARTVVAGLERLLGIHPYALNRLAKAMREGNWERVSHDLSGHAQRWLERMQVGDEVLGSEPLHEMIRAYVETSPSDTFQTMLATHQILMMATTTNLTEGEMRVIVSSDTKPTRLAEGLLASSAFPGVFRPRWSWELSDVDKQRCQYIDGGVIDNLPIESVTRFLDGRPLDNARNPKWAPQWKEHLIVVGSLESNIHPQLTYLERYDLLRNWRTLAQRAKKLGYNQKLDKYAWAERQRGEFLRADPERTEPAIRIVPVKPEWLCGTFAAHPMLGFRRERQKRSIAHGCASTLIRFAEPQLKSKLGCWGASPSAAPDVANWGDAFNRAESRSKNIADGKCWLRDVPCPFSEQELAKLKRQNPGDDGLPEELLRELSHIHQVCQLPETQLNPG